MSSAQLSLLLDVGFAALVLALLWLGSRYENLRTVLNFDLVPWLSRRSFDQETGAPLRTWKGAACIALTLLLALNAVALIAYGLSSVGTCEIGAEVAAFFSAFGFLGAIAVFLLQCPASFLKR